jgi:hypothetical protein
MLEGVDILIERTPYGGGHTAWRVCIKKEMFFTGGNGHGGEGKEIQVGGQKKGKRGVKQVQTSLGIYRNVPI